MKLTRCGSLCLASLGSILCSSTMAAGFYIPEVGTPGSMGSAGVINPTNTFSADAAWTNPAGMTGLNKDSIMTGMQLVIGSVEFESSIGPSGDDGGNAAVISPIPSFFYVRKLSDEARFGFSAVAPLGGGVDYGNDFVGRYVLTESALAAVALTPSLAYRINDELSVGAGVSVVYSSLEQDIALNQPGFADGKIKFDGLEDWGWQGVLSLTYQLNERVLMGVVYRSELDTELEGDIKLDGIQGTFSTQAKLELDWTTPQWLELGLRYQLNKETDIFFNAGWQEWSAFSQNQLTINAARDTVAVLDRQFDNTWHAGIALAHKLKADAVLTMGFAYDSSPVKDAHRTLDMPFDENYRLSTSYSWKGEGDFDYSIGGTLMMIGDAAVDQTAQGERVKGEYDSNIVLLLGGTLRYEF